MMSCNCWKIKNDIINDIINAICNALGSHIYFAFAISQITINLFIFMKEDNIILI